MNSKLTKEDLSQMDRQYFQTLENENLVEVACNLRNFAAELIERLEQDSGNSSKPPSSDDPFKKGSDTEDKKIKEKNKNESDKEDVKRSPGKQPGAEGFWRSPVPEAEEIIVHCPENCAACNRKIQTDEIYSNPYMGHYVFELEKMTSGIRIVCTLHHYYGAACKCGHETKERPGEGCISEVEGRKKDLKLTEYTIAGPMLAAFITALSVNYKMSRRKIREFLSYWYNSELSTGTIDKCIREAGVSCYPIVEELLDDLQKADIVKVDETSWYEKGCLKWIWVAVSSLTIIFHIGTRKKEELLNLITAAFIGWLVTDGYGAYRSYEKRQRCLAHLIRKAVGLTGAVDKKAQKMGDWFLRELRGLIRAMAEEGGDGRKKSIPILARLKKVCCLGSKSDHPKLKALAKEILNDWDAVVAFVKNPELPPTNNDAERALRQVVIARKISFGTRTTEGSKAYTSILSVIETCRLRNQDPWAFIAQTISMARKGIKPESIPIV